MVTRSTVAAPSAETLEGDPVTQMISRDKAKCELHATHHPMPTYFELHHVIPQQWQDVVLPPSWDQTRWSQDDQQMKDAFPYAAKSPDHAGLVLWDARTEALCRTGHGNTHYYLVKLMHMLHDNPSFGIEQAVDHVRVTEGNRTDPTAMRQAVQAIIRFNAAGCDLRVLWQASQWGQI